MRLVFMGTPDFAVPALAALHARGHDIAAAYTQPPRPSGRGQQPTRSAVQLAAEQRGVPVRHPASLRGADEQADFAALSADVAVVAAYGLILPRPVLEAPRHGCLNIHASLLPRWRGAAPIQRAILAGDTQTGVTIMRMEAGLDTGPMLAKLPVPVGRKTAGELSAELADAGARLIEGVLDALESFAQVPQPAEGVTYAAKIDKSETRLDFSAPAAQVERQIRAFAPSPGAFFEWSGERYRVLSGDLADDAGSPGEVLDARLTIACGEGAIRPTSIQRAGKPAMETAALLRGRAIPAGSRLG